MHYRFYNGEMRHGITIRGTHADEMMTFLNTSREDADHQPPAWVEWHTASSCESSESTIENESSGSSDSSDDDDDDEYQPFLHLPENPDGRRCRCGSTTHMTINSFACPLNPRNVAAAGATVHDDAAAGNDDSDESDDDDASAGNDDSDESDDDDASAANGDSDESDDDDASAANGDDDSDQRDDDDASAGNGADDSDDIPPNMEGSSTPLRPRRRLGMPTRRRRSSLGDTGLGPSRRRRRIQVEIDVGTKVKSPGTRWNLPATTIYNGEVIKKSMFRGAIRYEVKWQDGVVEYLREEHIVPLLC